MANVPIEKHRMLGTWSCLMGMIAMLILGVGSMKEIPYAPWQVNAWLVPHVVYPAVVAPTIVAFVCGVVSLLMTRGRWRLRMLSLGGYGCMMAVVCVLASLPMLGNLREARRKSQTRACIANMRNIDSATSQGMIEEPAIACKWTNSAMITPDYLKDPQEICCPCMPGVPYPCSPCDTDGTTPDVWCPAREKYPKKYADHTD